MEHWSPDYEHYIYVECVYDYSVVLKMFTTNIYIFPQSLVSLVIGLNLFLFCFLFFLTYLKLTLCSNIAKNCEKCVAVLILAHKPC